MAIGIGKREFVAVRGSAASLAWPPTIRRLLELSAAALAASTIACSAGPCSPEIERMQARLDARLQAAARAGPSAPESSRALHHRQPTPGSIASAEIGLGEISPEGEGCQGSHGPSARSRPSRRQGGLRASARGGSTHDRSRMGEGSGDKRVRCGPKPNIVL